MKTLGLIGGMSWESTLVYYQHINTQIKQRKGGLHSAPLIVHSVDFAEIARLQHENNWPVLAEQLANIARQLETAGAEGLLICTNTMHKVATEVAKMVRIPLLHIGDALISASQRQGFKTLGLLGTQFTMEQPFLKGYLQDAGLSIVTPDSDDRQTVHRIIYDELCLGKIDADSRKAYQQVIEKLQQAGAEAVIFGCTEIGLLLSPQQSCLPVLNSVLLHAEAGAEFVLSDN